MASLNFVTQVGTFAYPHLNRPSKKFGKFEVSLVLPKDAAEDMVKAVRKIAVDEFGRAKAVKAKYPFDVDAEKGTVTLKARSDYMPELNNPKGLEYAEDGRPNVGSGTTGRLRVTFKTYDMKGNGVTCYLNGAQVKNLVIYKPGGSFDAFEDAADDGIEETSDTTSGFGDFDDEGGATEETKGDDDGFNF